MHVSEGQIDHLMDLLVVRSINYFPRKSCDVDPVLLSKQYYRFHRFLTGRFIFGPISGKSRSPNLRFELSLKIAPYTLLARKKSVSCSRFEGVISCGAGNIEFQHHGSF